MKDIAINNRSDTGRSWFKEYFLLEPLFRLVWLMVFAGGSILCLTYFILSLFIGILQDWFIIIIWILSAFGSIVVLTRVLSFFSWKCIVLALSGGLCGIIMAPFLMMLIGIPLALPIIFFGKDMIFREVTFVLDVIPGFILGVGLGSGLAIYLLTVTGKTSNKFLSKSILIMGGFIGLIVGALFFGVLTLSHSGDPLIESSRMVDVTGFYAASLFYLFFSMIFCTSYLPTIFALRRLTEEERQALRQKLGLRS